MLARTVLHSSVSSLLCLKWFVFYFSACYELDSLQVFTFTKSISSGAQYVTSQKCVSHPSLVLYVFPTPPIKLELGLQIGGRLLIATHLNQSNYLANEHQLLPGFVVSFTSLSERCKKCWAETILLNQTGMF